MTWNEEMGLRGLKRNVALNLKSLSHMFRSPRQQWVHMEPFGNVLLCKRSHKHLHTTTPTRKIIAGLLGNMWGAPAELSSWINHHSSLRWSPFSANENFTCFIVEAQMTTSCFQAFKRFLCPHVPVFHNGGCLFSL